MSLASNIKEAVAVGRRLSKRIKIEGESAGSHESCERAVFLNTRIKTRVIQHEVQARNAVASANAWKNAHKDILDELNGEKQKELYKTKLWEIKSLNMNTSVLDNSKTIDEGLEYQWNSVRQFEVNGKRYILGNYPGLYMKPADEIISENPIDVPTVEPIVAMNLALNGYICHVGQGESSADVDDGALLSMQQYACAYCFENFDSQEAAMAHSFGSGPVRLTGLDKVHRLGGKKRLPCQKYLASVAEHPKRTVKMPKLVEL
ncbi:hypothetical protein HDE_00447 [Halotydeus destructor]|nr:hypothetical protein HDE_00447 [Halotydeus destructor]